MMTKRSLLTTKFIIFLLLFIFLNRTASAMNMLENSSFEVGLGHIWGFDSSNRINGQLDPVRQDDAYHGSSSLKLEFYDKVDYQMIVSKIMRLRPNTKYVFSFYAKSDYSAPDLNIKVMNTFQIPHGPGDFSETQIRLSDKWARYSYQFNTANVPDKSSYQIYIWPHGQSIKNKYVWIDAIQLEMGTLSPYQPNSQIDIGASTGNPSAPFLTCRIGGAAPPAGRSEIRVRRVVSAMADAPAKAICRSHALFV